MEQVSIRRQTRLEREENRRKRLSSRDWVRAGLDALVEGGVEGVRVDTLAKKLSVTKGSFYWHFTNREQLLDAIAKFWGESELDNVIEEILTLKADPKMRLALFAVLYTRENLPPYDRAMRAWAMTDPRAAKAVKKANSRVEKMMVTLYQEIGFDSQEATFRARLQILCGIGMLFAVEYHDLQISEKEQRELGDKFMDFLTQRTPTGPATKEAEREAN